MHKWSLLRKISSLYLFASLVIHFLIVFTRRWSMEKIKEKFQEKFQKWLNNFCLRGNCSSVRAGLKYFTRYRLPLFCFKLWRAVSIYITLSGWLVKKKIKKKRLYAIISFLDFHELPRLCSSLSCTSSTWKFVVPCNYRNEEFWCLHIFDHRWFSK